MLSTLVLSSCATSVVNDCLDFFDFLFCFLLSTVVALDVRESMDIASLVRSKTERYLGGTERRGLKLLRVSELDMATQGSRHVALTWFRVVKWLLFLLVLRPLVCLKRLAYTLCASPQNL